MATYAREHPLQSIIAIAAALVLLALGFYVATANAGSGRQARADDRGGTILLRDDPAGDDRGGLTGVSDNPAGHDAIDDNDGLTGVSDDPAGHDAGDDRGGETSMSDDPAGDDHGGDN